MTEFFSGIVSAIAMYNSLNLLSGSVSAIAMYSSLNLISGSVSASAMYISLNCFLKVQVQLHYPSPISHR